MLEFSDLFFLIGIPVIQQILKLIADRRGRTLGKLGNQILTVALSFVFAMFTDGFAGIDLPVLPDLAGLDLLLGVEAVLQFLAAFVGALGAMWAVLMALYESIGDRLFTALRAGTADKYF